ncbi:MAG: hypothetical protein HPY85_08250 [Anaerolineae bacterium]|nr:hypothetical protein [Anaerolineae bacterium]
MAKKVDVEEVVAEAGEKAEEITEQAVEKVKEASKSVFGLLRKVFLASVGAAVVAEEELVNLINRLVERGEIAENDAKEMIKEILDKRQKEAKETIEKIRQTNTVKVATKCDIEALQEKIDALSAKLDELKAE